MKKINVLNPDFGKELEYLAKTKKIDYMDAAILWCEINGFEVEYVGELIKKHAVLKSKIMIEAENLNFMKKTPRLPI